MTLTTFVLWTTLTTGLVAGLDTEVATGVAGSSQVTSGSTDSETFEDWDRARMEELLLHGRVSSSKRIAVGVSGSSRAVVTSRAASHAAHVQSVDGYFGSGHRFTDLSDNYRYNIAAYRLDRMLDLGMVPVSVERMVNGRPAAVTWWVDDVEMMELDRRRLSLAPVDVRAWNEQMRRAAIFQELISNSDCNQTNLLITRNWRVWLVDFTRAFRTHPRLMRPEAVVHLDGRLREKLESLDEAGLKAEMKGLLNRAQIRGILARRDLILQSEAASSNLRERAS